MDTSHVLWIHYMDTHNPNMDTYNIIWIQNNKMDTKTLNGYSIFNGYQKHTMDTNCEYGYLYRFIIFHMDTLLLRWIIYV